jgi:hypothetical protein
MRKQMKNRESSSPCRSNERGVAMLEFAIVFPFIIALAMFATEIARFIKVAQLATALAQEAANETYRLCADIPGRAGLPALKTATANCVLTNVSGTLMQAIQNNFPAGQQVDIILRVERYDGSLNELAAVSSNAARASLYTYSADGTTVSNNGRVLLTDLPQRGRLVTAEVYYPLNSWMYQIPFLGGVVFRNVINGQEYYAAATL